MVRPTLDLAAIALAALLVGCGNSSPSGGETVEVATNDAAAGRPDPVLDDHDHDHDGDDHHDGDDDHGGAGESHVHGKADLAVALTPTGVELALLSPLYNLVGFEGAPDSAEKQSLLL
ncbi:MAG: DUF2796 domain-containing protein, partial [Pseudomonadota bacterium]